MGRSELTDSKGKKIDQLEIDAASDPVDAFFTRGTYEDGTEVSGDELDELTMLYPEVIRDMWFDKMRAKAESYHEGDR